MPSHKSFGAVLAQALADPATVLLVSLASESRKGILCEVVSPHGFSVGVTTDGDLTACPLDVHQGLFSSSVVCQNSSMVSIQVKGAQIDIGPVTRKERVAYTTTSVHRMEATVYLENGDTRLETGRLFVDLFRVSFEAPRTALVQICEG